MNFVASVDADDIIVIGKLLEAMKVADEGRTTVCLNGTIQIRAFNRGEFEGSELADPVIAEIYQDSNAELAVRFPDLYPGSAPHSETRKTVGSN